MEILQPKVQYGGLADLIGVGVVKQVEERLTAPYIGNGTLVSGGIKLVAGALCHGHAKNSRIGNIICSAVLVDAGEDLAVGLINMFGGGGIGGGNRSQDEFGG